jgi:primary-amine oxidase
LIDNLTGNAFELQCVFPSTETNNETSSSNKLQASKPTLASFKQLPLGVQPAITLEELDETEEVVCNDPEVIRLCEEVGVGKEEIRADCWSIGYEERFGEGRRLQQAFVYARKKEHEHLYAHPLDFNVVVE